MSPKPAVLPGARRHIGHIENFTDMSPDGETLKDLNSFHYHHSLDCGHVVRATDGHCASNCLVDDMVNDVKDSLPFTCYACFGAFASLAVGHATARDSAPGVMHFLLNNDRASLTDRSRCCGSQGAQYMLRSTRQRRERAQETRKSKRKAVDDLEEGSSSKRTRLPASKSTMSLSIRPGGPPESVASSSRMQLRPRAPAELPGFKQIANYAKASRKLPVPFAKTSTDVGRERVRRSQRVWTNYGETSNIASMLTSLEQFGTSTNVAEHDTLATPKPQEKASARMASVRQRLILNSSALVVGNIVDYFPNIERDESPSNFIKSEPDDDDNSVSIFNVAIDPDEDTLHPTSLIAERQVKAERVKPCSVQSDGDVFHLTTPQIDPACPGVNYIKSEYPDYVPPYHDGDTFQSALSLFAGLGTQGAPYFKQEDYSHNGIYIKREFQDDATKTEIPDNISHLTPEGSEGTSTYIKQEWELELDIMYDPTEELEVFALIMESDLEIIDLSGPYFAPEVKQEGEEFTHPLPVLAPFQLAFRPHPFEVEMALSGEDIFDELLVNEQM